MTNQRFAIRAQVPDRAINYIRDGGPRDLRRIFRNAPDDFAFKMFDDFRGDAFSTTFQASLLSDRFLR